MKVITPSESGLPPEVAEHYRLFGVLPDGRICGVHRLLFHWTMHIGVDDIGYAERYCFETFELAKTALETWSGEGDPEGWHKHPDSGRYRDPNTGDIWHESEKNPSER